MTLKRQLTYGIIGMTAFAAVIIPSSTIKASVGNAGISGLIADTLEADTRATSGINAYLAGCMELFNAKATLMENGDDIVLSGYGEICGFKNVGIAQVEGNLNVREEPNEEAKMVGKMPGDSACEILGVEGEWTKIESGKVSGYVKSEYLLTGFEGRKKADELKSVVASCNTITLRVREEATTESEIIALMGEGEEVEVEEEDLDNLGDWIKVSVDDEIGYVSADYVEIKTKLPTAMTMTEVQYGQGVSDIRVALTQYACQFVGNPYVWGGTSLTKGADCSGFVLSIFAKYGIYLPHSSRAQAGYGRRISASEAKPGDLFFYGSGKSISHVAIYIGNGQIVHASSKKTGIKISNAYYRSPICVTSLLN